MPDSSKTFRSAGSSAAFNEAAAALLRDISRNSISYVISKMESNELGLSEETAEERLEKFGTNEIHHEKAPAWVIQLLHAFINPFIFILILIAGISSVIDVFLAKPGSEDYKTIVIISVMILISALLRFIQEYRSSKEAEQLKAMVKTTATVRRPVQGKLKIDISRLVPGDIIHLSAGDMIPADCRILQSKDLFVSESMLTGESLPVEKQHTADSEAADKQPVNLSNICFMGTNVVSGSAAAIIITTGSRTFFGSISKKIAGRRPETSFDRGINRVSLLLIRFMVIMVPLIFLINGLLKGDWTEALLFAVAVAVGLTPEMLPMIVTANLAKGAVSMSRQKVIVKRLNAIQNLGGMDILCTDKTGTLTIDKVVLERHLNAYGADDDEVLKWAYLNSYHQTGLKNLMDEAILEHVEVNKYIKVDEYYTRIDEIPFDFERRRMSVILEMKNGRHLLVCKGAVEEMLALCDRAFDPGEDLKLHTENDEIVPMDAQMKESVLSISNKLNADGIRVLLVAIREFDGSRALNYGVKDENKLIFTGFIGFLDPAKPSAKLAIEKLQQQGVTVKVLTGDNEIVSRKICKDVGLDAEHIISGENLDDISDSELLERVGDTVLFAKLNPLQKVRVVKALQSKGHAVGFLGDGINDAAALKEADVGISVDTAVDITKESADIILLDKDLTVLQKGVEYGRTTFGNIIKYIKITVSSNFGNMFSVLGASVFLPFLPMLPIHLLVQNLLYDISQTAIPWDNVDEEFIAAPQKWDASGIAKFMLYIGPVSSIFDFVMFAVLWFIFKANAPEHQALFQSGWFIEGLISQVMIVHIIRTKRIPFFKSKASAPLISLTVLIMVIGAAIPFMPFAAALHMVPLPFSYFPWLIAVLAAYALTAEFAKKWFIRKFSYWL